MSPVIASHGREEQRWLPRHVTLGLWRPGASLAGRLSLPAKSSVKEHEPLRVLEPCLSSAAAPGSCPMPKPGNSGGVAGDGRSLLPQGRRTRREELCFAAQLAAQTV